MALIPSDPRTQRRLLLALAPLLLLLGYWYFYHGSKQQELAELEERLEVLEARNANARARSRDGQELEKKLALYEEHIRRLEKLVPRSEEVPELLYDLTLRAQENGVELALLNPHAEEPGIYYSLHTYDIAVYGSYHDIGRYLSAIGSLPRIVTPYDLRLQPRQEKGRSGAVRLQAEFQIKTYVLPPPMQAAS